MKRLLIKGKKRKGEKCTTYLVSVEKHQLCEHRYTMRGKNQENATTTNQ